MSELQKAHIVSFDPHKQIGSLRTDEQKGVYVIFGTDTENVKFAAEDEVALPKKLHVGQRITVSTKPITNYEKVGIVKTIRQSLGQPVAKTQIEIIHFAQREREIIKFEQVRPGSSRHYITFPRLVNNELDGVLGFGNIIWGDKANAELSSNVPGDTEQIPHFDEIWESIAQDVFADKRDFLQWLVTPNETIDQQKPILLLVEGGDLDLLKQLLGRFEHGIMA